MMKVLVQLEAVIEALMNPSVAKDVAQQSCDYYPAPKSSHSS
jgi:hypothetical protein